MPPVDEHGELDEFRPAEVDKGVHRGPYRPPGKEDVVDQNDLLAVKGKGDVRPAQKRSLVRQAQVIAVESDVQGAGRQIYPFDLCELLLKPFGEEDAARPDSSRSTLHPV